MFSQTSTRTAPGLGGNRLQNGKLGNNAGASPSSWLPAAAASRSTFAQTLGGQQAPLDPSEFPSLGAPSQGQNNSAAQSLWSNPSIRATAQQPQSAIQRTPQPPSSNQQPPQDDFGPGSDAYRFGGSSQLAGLGSAPQQQSGTAEEFPPLGRIGQSEEDRRSNLLAGFTGQPGLGLQGGRLGLDQADITLGGLGGDRNPTPRGRTLTNPNPFPAPEPSQTPLGLGGLGSGFGNTPVGYRGRNGFPEPGASAAMSPDLGFNPPDQISLPAPTPRSRQVSGPSSAGGKKRLADMTPRERNGLMGLAAKLDPDHPDYSQLAVGQDLTVLGLELNRPDSTPLYSTFATPFGPPNQAARPAVPDFTLPAAYRVQNVPPLHTKISSMSDEGLMAVFYTMPRDLAQEMSAQELYNRDWRWHMRHRIWLQKDPSFAAPTRIDAKQERGFYIIFNVNQWRKERREILLNYDDLEQRPVQFQSQS